MEEHTTIYLPNYLVGIGGAPPLPPGSSLLVEGPHLYIWGVIGVN